MLENALLRTVAFSIVLKMVPATAWAPSPECPPTSLHHITFSSLLFIFQMVTSLMNPFLHLPKVLQEERSVHMFAAWTTKRVWNHWKSVRSIEKEVSILPSQLPYKLKYPCWSFWHIITVFKEHPTSSSVSKWWKLVRPDMVQFNHSQ